MLIKSKNYEQFHKAIKIDLLTPIIAIIFIAISGCDINKNSEQNKEGINQDTELSLLSKPSELSESMQENSINPIDREITLILRDIVKINSPDNSSTPARVNSIAIAPDKPERLYIVDMDGVVHIFENGALNPNVFLDMKQLGDIFIHNDMEKGLSSIAFHPDFNNPSSWGYGRLYTASTESSESGTADFFSPEKTNPVSHHDVIAEWRVDQKNPDRVDMSSRREVMRIAHPYRDHTIGMVSFNPTSKPGDAEYGLLYIGVGDGGNTIVRKGEIDYFRTAQNGLLPFGKILRINPKPEGSLHYSVSLDNPFVGNKNYLGEIWAYGLRNPQRFSWDTGSSHRMFIADIGQAKVEEINIGLVGGNYGWSEREGTFVTQHKDENYIGQLSSDDKDNHYIYPLAQYQHDVGKAVSGGYVYRGKLIPELQGSYLFGDIATGDVFFLDTKEMASKSTITNARKIRIKYSGRVKTFLEITNKARADLHFGIDGNGELYTLTKVDGAVRKFSMLDK